MTKTIFILLTSALLTGCGCSRLTQSVAIETVRHDTLYVNNVQYDSIHIDSTSETDRTRDTVTITRTMTEYRYRLLRDTIRIVHRDSIPYEVRIIEERQVLYIPTWCKWLSSAGGIALLLLTIGLLLMIFRIS